jgi:uncharacterized protein (TIGR03435 family)
MDFEDNEYESLLQQFQPRKPAPLPDIRKARTRQPAFWIGIAAAVVLLAALSWVVPAYFWKVDAHAVVESVDGSVNRLSEGHSQIAQAGSRISSGEVLHTDSGARATFALADGSRVEMRSQSDVGLESAEDGIRLRLNSGGIIVTAAKQAKGHLYVETRDLTVSVVGTVFYVTAEQVGSRVAVVEGEVHVQQGQTVKKLLPGEQIATEPSMLTIPVEEEIAFSRMAPAHVAMLQQQSTVPVEPRLTFDEISIRPAAPGGFGGGGRGGVGGGGGGGRGGVGPGGSACSGMVQLNPGRIVMSNVTLYRLMNLAYGKNCRASNEIDLINGVPDWGRSQAYDIQATIPAGSVVYSIQQLNNGDAPKLQSMLQNMLADRFSFALHHDTKEIPLYNLLLVKPGKIKLSEDQTAPEQNFGPVATGGPPPLRDPNVPFSVPRGGFLFTVNPTEGKVNIAAMAIPLSTLISIFQGQEGRLVIDKTGMKGLYDIPESTLDVGPFDLAPGAVSVWPEIMRQLGMKLEPARGPGEILVIDHVDKPSEN